MVDEKPFITTKLNTKATAFRKLGRKYYLKELQSLWIADPKAVCRRINNLRNNIIQHLTLTLAKQRWHLLKKDQTSRPLISGSS